VDKLSINFRGCLTGGQLIVDKLSTKFWGCLTGGQLIADKLLNFGVVLQEAVDCGQTVYYILRLSYGRAVDCGQTAHDL
jgi:hypothetical protein